MINSDLDTLLKTMSRLPGLGPRSARRVVLHLLNNREKVMRPLIEALKLTDDKMVDCKECGTFSTISPCSICVDTSRPQQQICVVETVADLWAMERSGSFSGVYHVLGGHLSVMDNRGPDALRVDVLKQRIKDRGIQEVILALNATIDGQTTAHFLANELKDMSIKISSLARGIPLGGELDYMDDGTLATALNARFNFEMED